MAWYNLELKEHVNRPFPFFHTRSVEKTIPFMWDDYIGPKVYPSAP